jgi:hypothetical protein
MMGKGYYVQERIRLLREIVREHGPITAIQAAGQLREIATSRIGAVSNNEVAHLLGVMYAREGHNVRSGGLACIVRDRHYVYQYTSAVKR